MPTSKDIAPVADMEDTLKPGFVSAIIMKFSQFSSTSKHDDDKFTSCKKTPSYIKKAQIKAVNPSENTFEAKFEITGDVNVKDKIMAFSSMSNAVTSASRRPGVMVKKELSAFQNSEKRKLPIAKSNVANKFLQSVEKKMDKKQQNLQRIDAKNFIRSSISIDYANVGSMFEALNEKKPEPKVVAPVVKKPVEEPKKIETIKEPEPVAKINSEEESDSKSQEFEFREEYTLADLAKQSHTEIFKMTDLIDDETMYDIVKQPSGSVSSVSSLLNEFESSEEEKRTYPDTMYPENDPNYYPLPKTYGVSYTDGVLLLSLPEPSRKSCLRRNNGTKTANKRKIHFYDQPFSLMETYGCEEYERGDDSIDPLTASAEYEIEKKTENLEKFIVEFQKDERGLGLSIVGIGLGSDNGSEKLAIYIKALTSGGAAERTNKFMVHDQILEVDGTSLVGVTQSFAAQTLKGTKKDVRFLVGRDKTLQQNS